MNNIKQKLIKSSTLKSVLIFALVFCLFSILAIGIYNNLVKRETLLQSQATADTANNILSHIEFDLLKRVQSLNRMAMRGEARKGMSRDEFELDAEAYIRDDLGYQAMSWTNSDYIVRWIVPLEGNEDALNLDLKTIPEELEGIEDSINAKDVTVAPPLDLAQGGKGFIMTRAIRVDDKITGFVQSVFRTQPWLSYVLSSDYNLLKNNSFMIQISMDGSPIFSNTNWSKAQYKDKEEAIENIYMGRRFLVKARPAQSFIDSQATFLPKFVLIIGLLISLLISSIVFLYQKANQAVKITKRGSRRLKLEINERISTEALLAKERQRLSYILEGTNVGTWEWDMQTGEIALNERGAETLGYTIEELAPITMKTREWLTHPDDSKKSNALLKQHLKGDLDYYECEVRMRHKNGSWVWLLDKGKILLWSDDKKALLMCGTFQDITIRKEAEMKVLYLAQHDSLTGLANLHMAQDRMQMILKQAKRNKTQAAFMFIDLDGFKKINDQSGHDAGDHVLKISASRLLASVREVDTVARIGGDEFLIVLTEPLILDMAEEVAQRIIDNLSKDINYQQETLNVSASIGISIYPLHGETTQGLIKEADKAMYDTKAAGKNSYTFAKSSS